MPEMPSNPQNLPYRRRPWRKFFFALSWFSLGLALGLIGSHFLPQKTSSLTEYNNAQNQTAQSLKSLHDKLDQLDSLNTSVNQLTRSISQLDQTISLEKDLESLTQNPLTDTAVLGTASAETITPTE